MSDTTTAAPMGAEEFGHDGRARRDARVAGAVAATISLSVLWLAASFWRGAPFGPSAIAEAAIRLTPGGLATFFIEALGGWARRLTTLGAIGISLVVGMEALVLTVRRDDGPRPAVAGAVLALLSGAASFAAPATNPNIPVLAAVLGVAYVTYVVAAGKLLRALGRVELDHDGSRRRVIRAGLYTAFGIAAGGTVLGWMARAFTGGPDTDVKLVAPVVPADVPSRAGFPEVDGISSEVTSTADHYVVDINLVQPAVEADGWRLRVFGAVDRELELSFRGLQRRFEIVQEYSVLCCVSNDVGGDLIGNSAWGGVRLADVLEEAGPLEGAFDVVFRAADGYSDSIPLDLARRPHVLLAVSQNDRPLTQEHGFPCRVRIPSIYGMKNVKWLESIEVVESDYKGYWQERGWSDDATVRTQSRIDVAGDDRSARRGEATWIAGVAWAGDRGISKVEVSTDGGETWNAAELREPISQFSWSQWAYRWTPSQGEDALVMCRATDGDGQTQTDDIAPPHPAGATGYHKVTVRVS
jgi:DMSO/TMAO reductase YedYZ molybdopterin-dependent catalytic subunit